MLQPGTTAVHTPRVQRPTGRWASSTSGTLRRRNLSNATTSDVASSCHVPLTPSSIKTSLCVISHRVANCGRNVPKLNYDISFYIA